MLFRILVAYTGIRRMFSEVTGNSTDVFSEFREKFPDCSDKHYNQLVIRFIKKEVTLEAFPNSWRLHKEIGLCI